MTLPLHRRWPFIAALFVPLLAVSCQGTGPVEPTVIVLPTSTVMPSPTIIPITVAPLTAVPSATIAVTPTALQTIPPRPIPLTLNQTAEAPIRIVSNNNGATQLKITEAQLNTALKHRFELSPLANYAEAPTVTFVDASLTLSEKITPSSLAAVTSAQP